jgi:hypothetical protein
VTFAERFWATVDTSGGPDSCWPWIGYLGRNGYGLTKDESGKLTNAHRLALEMALGRKLAKAEDAMHGETCVTRACCNQAHLTAGPHKKNMEDAARLGRMQRGERHYRAALTEREVIEMRQARAVGARTIDLARAFQVTRGNVIAVVTGVTWKHVGGPVTPIHSARSAPRSLEASEAAVSR